MIKDEIKLECLGLQVGDTVRTDCLACGGDKTMTVTRFNDRLVYNCYRASCGVRGVLGSRSAQGGFNQIDRANKAAEERQRLRAEKFDAVYNNREELPQEYEDKLRSTFNFLPPTGGIIRAEQGGDRILYNVRDHIGRLVGFVARRYDWTNLWSGPKAVAYGYSDHHWATKPTNQYRDRARPQDTGVVVVEDIVSAEKVLNLTGRASVALLGTSLSDECLSSIVKQNPNHIDVFLDPGAEGAALNVAKKLRLFVSDVRIILADSDPKDLTKRELDVALG